MRIFVLCELFSIDQIEQINSIKLPNSGTDTIRWNLTTSGNFYTKSVYKAILQA